MSSSASSFNCTRLPLRKVEVTDSGPSASASFCFWSPPVGGAEDEWGFTAAAGGRGGGAVPKTSLWISGWQCPAQHEDRARRTTPPCLQSSVPGNYILGPNYGNLSSDFGESGVE